MHYFIWALLLVLILALIFLVFFLKLRPVLREKLKDFEKQNWDSFQRFFTWHFSKVLFLDWRGREFFLNSYQEKSAVYLNEEGTSIIKRLILSKELKKLHQNLEIKITKINQEFIKAEEAKYSSFFGSIGAKGLSKEQINAVISDDSVTLVNAGAGSGKTSVIAAKVIHLVQNKKIDPSKILLLSFSRKAAVELTERIHKLNPSIQIKAKTLHALGSEIFRKVHGKGPELLFGSAEDNSSKAFFDLLFEFSKTLVDDPDFVYAIFRYFGRFHENIRPYHDYKSYEDYRDARRKLGDLNVSPYLDDLESCSVKTFSGVMVRSMEEKRIADFFYIHGVNFEYESHYPYRNNYRPDFYLPDADVYLEHFGIDRDGKVPDFFVSKNPMETASQSYQKDILWKRQLHKKNGTRLFETYSYNVKEDTLDDILSKILESLGYKLLSRNKSFILKRLLKDIVPLMKRSIDSFKLSGLKLASIKDDLMKRSLDYESKKHLAMFEIFEYYLKEYEDYLENHGLIDFSDLLTQGKLSVQNDWNELGFNFEYIIVDEFQDTSRLAINFINEIWKKNIRTRFFFVGDDWQSIYGFNGSDYTLMSEIRKMYGHVNEVTLSTNYRSTKEIVDLTQEFIKKNPRQTQKVTRAREDCPKGQIRFEGLETFFDFFNEYIKEVIVNGDELSPSVLFLSRNNQDITGWKEIIDVLTILERKFPTHSLDLLEDIAKKMFSTIHSAKGGEADLVVILPSKQGIPSPMVDHKFLGLFQSNKDNFEFSEERRVFYVAMTRAKKELVFIEDKNFIAKNYIFWNEVKELVPAKD